MTYRVEAYLEELKKGYNDTIIVWLSTRCLKIWKTSGSEIFRMYSNKMSPYKLKEKNIELGDEFLRLIYNNQRDQLILNLVWETLITLYNE